MVAKFPALNEIDEAFLRMLRADSQPLSDAALFWHELVSVAPGPPAKARTRGDDFLSYVRQHATIKEVPGRSFSEDKLPHGVCSRLMNEHAASSECPRFIAFRYDRTGSGWDGGCRIETRAQYREQVLSRKKVDAKLTEALREQFAPGVESVGILYGLRRWQEPGPKLRMDLGKEKPLEFRDVEGAVHEAWEGLVAHLKACGAIHLYYADIKLEKPSSTLREGDSIQLRYSV
jgi:hypothetical protein